MPLVLGQASSDNLEIGAAVSERDVHGLFTREGLTSKDKGSLGKRAAGATRAERPLELSRDSGHLALILIHF